MPFLLAILIKVQVLGFFWRGEEAYFFQEKWMMMVSGVSDAEGEGGGVVTKSQTKRCSSKEENLTKVTPAGGCI